MYIMFGFILININADKRKQMFQNVHKRKKIIDF